ncbi:MAG: FixH family protein [Gammaproteobacteria bacterium]
MSTGGSSPAQLGARAWYREPFVWLLIAIPLSSVVVGFAILGLSIYSFDGLVVDDYYQRGKQINRVLARDRFAAEADMQAELRFDPKARRLRLNLHARPGVYIAAKDVELSFLHPTRSGQDQLVRLSRISADRFGAAHPTLSPGRWIVQLGTTQWRLVGSMRMPEAFSVRLLPAGVSRPDT